MVGACLTLLTASARNYGRLAWDSKGQKHGSFLTMTHTRKGKGIRGRKERKRGIPKTAKANRRDRKECRNRESRNPAFVFIFGYIRNLGCRKKRHKPEYYLKPWKKTCFSGGNPSYRNVGGSLARAPGGTLETCNPPRIRQRRCPGWEMNR